MGLFAVAKNYDDSSVEELILAAKANIHLYLQHDRDMEYLLRVFAVPQLDNALKKIREQE